MTLNIIDFSNGIRPEEIQENFNYLQEQLSRERLSVGGSGIASGLEVSFEISEDKFDLIVTDGSVIDEEGNEIFIKGKTISVPPPEMYMLQEYCVLDEDRTITLKHTPYALNRRRPVQYTYSYEPEYSGISIKYKNSLNKDDYIRVRDIIDTTVTVTGALKRELDVVYYYTANRIDTLYINNKFEVDYKVVTVEGTTSTTPSISALPLDAKYLIAYIAVDSEYVDEVDTTPHAWMYIKDDLRSIRNLYTAADGTLYICNIPFDDLQIIHLKEPQNPKEYTLWLNIMDNTLYCWRPIDDFVYKNVIDVTTDFLENITTADLTFSTYMSFMMGGEELSVYLNGSQLDYNVDYEEVGIDLPTAAGNEGIENVRGNVFRILEGIRRPDEYEDVLVPGDQITYTIRYKDSQYMWVPINRMNYINVKNRKVYSTWYEGISNKYIYEKNKFGDDKAYFDSELANSLGKDPVNYYPYKYQYFLFHRTDDMNMHFTPGKNELSVMINQMYLHEDQFKEITVFDIIERKLPDSVLAAAASKFGWTTQYLDQNFNGMYDNSGIGFMLVEPLDSGAQADGNGSSWENLYGSDDLFVEAIVERRVCATPMNRKLERSATFILEDTVEVNNDIVKTKIIELNDVKYRYDEHQLEVFINGVKQIKDKDYIEEYGSIKYFKDDGDMDEKFAPINEDEKPEDQDYFIRKKAAVCTKFKFLKDLSIGALITYKITTNVYSYDHINNILDDIGDILTDCKATVENNTTLMEELQDNLNARMEAIEMRVQDYIDDHSDFLTSDSIINIGQMPAISVNNMIKSLEHINTSIQLNKQGSKEYELLDIYPEDYLTVIYHQYISNTDSYVDSYWLNGVHYEIKQSALDSKKTVLKVLTNYNQNGHDVLYLSGLKLSNKHSFETVDYNGKFLNLVTLEQLEAYINNLFVTPINKDGDSNE